MAQLLLLCYLLFVCWTAPAVAADLEDEILQVIRNHPEVIVESLQHYQQQQLQQVEHAKNQALKEIESNPAHTIGQSPRTGDIKERILLIEFSDFQCPYCAEVHDTLKQFLASHQDAVTLVYKNFPLTLLHSESSAAAKASWAANRQGKFWPYHDALFARQGQLGEAVYLDIAKSLDMDLERFNRNRSSREADAAIQNDVELAQMLGIRGTPSFVMGSEVFSGAVEQSRFEAILHRVQGTALNP